MNYPIVNLLLGAPEAQKEDFRSIEGPWIGLDHGNISLLNQKIIPEVSAGDFDSLTSKEKIQLEENCPDIRYANPVKDFTDSQLGVQIALEDLKAQHVRIYGALGGRIDHELINLFLPLDLPRKQDIPKLELLDAGNSISYYLPGKYQITKLASMKYLGFFNLTPVEHFTIFDAKYCLHDASVQRPISWSSNEFVRSTVDFEFQSGVMAVIQSRDQNS
ncbi:thiamine diphosphokinase [Lactobacillus sp. DCY120]|uniref:Thiamine diphosphokinase n=1 Tax=Bombilactobacillus apium TaxID=2675299 RepID=A0A850R1I2_9LACO|nr:thiamine diphosphokinase [Bombilactobacillus apium]NVY96969.1 thiamine diphosphokinase [Bombilactobacillus apium]